MGTYGYRFPLPPVLSIRQWRVMHLSISFIAVSSLWAGASVRYLPFPNNLGSDVSLVCVLQKDARGTKPVDFT